MPAETLQCVEYHIGRAGKGKGTAALRSSLSGVTGDLLRKLASSICHAARHCWVLRYSNKMGKGPALRSTGMSWIEKQMHKYVITFSLYML